MYKPQCSVSDILATSQIIMGQLKLASVSRERQLDPEDLHEGLRSLAAVVDHCTNLPMAAFTDEEIDLVSSITQFIADTIGHESLAEDDFEPPENYEDSC